MCIPGAANVVSETAWNARWGKNWVSLKGEDIVYAGNVLGVYGRMLPVMHCSCMQSGEEALRQGLQLWTGRDWWAMLKKG